MLNTKSLREQVYEYLRDEIHNRNLLPGSTINLNKISQQLGISKTPLRDAIIQLEIEGFVTILPRRGVTVKKLTLQEIKDSYEVVGALEGSVILNEFDKITASHITHMEKLNDEQKAALENEDHENYYKLNLNFHNIFNSLSENKTLMQLITPFKQRLYDFPRRGYIKEWEMNNCNEHDQFIDLVKKKDREGAARIMRDVHWSYTVQEKYILQFYKNANGNL
ncbi:MAG: GntR family transcriptional regulator [Desulfobacterales bacterium]|jgi:DNA-binding GntR family transcriptional regulator